jgi:hypothetical protein
MADVADFRAPVFAAVDALSFIVNLRHFPNPTMIATSRRGIVLLARTRPRHVTAQTRLSCPPMPEAL